MKWLGQPPRILSGCRLNRAANLDQASTNSSTAPPGPAHLLGQVWVTRSQPGAERLSRAIQNAGFRTLVAPVLTIQPLPVQPLATPVPDVLLVLSEQAVTQAPPALWKWLRSAALPRVLAIGATTAQALSQVGFRAEVPPVESSEGLLDAFFNPPTNSLAATGRVLVLAGTGGRGVLAPALTDLNLEVTELAVYQRVEVAQLALNPGDIGAIVASSGDGVTAIQRIWREAGGKMDVAIFTASLRVLELARGFGFSNAYNCAGANAAAVCRALQAQFRPSSHR